MRSLLSQQQKAKHQRLIRGKPMFHRKPVTAAGNTEVPDKVTGKRVHPSSSRLPKLAAIKLEPCRALKSDTVTTGCQLLSDSIHIFKALKTRSIHTKELLFALCAYKKIYRSYNNGRPITDGQLARFLRPFGIASERFVLNGIRGRGYLKKGFIKAYRLIRE